MAYFRKMKSTFRHLCMLVLLTFYFLVGFTAVSAYITPSENPGESYNIILNILLYFGQACVLVSLPFTIFNIVGLVFLNPFSTPPKETLSADMPFICFRVVTRGLFPHLVRTTTLHNIELCRRNGLNNFKFEIVTDKPLSMGNFSDIIETVVPDQYRSAKNAMYKARALQYCLEPDINILSNADWIVHLDEETKLTDDVIYGIADFVTSSNADIGQGVIVYADDVIENWIITLMDGVRVAFDYGVMRLALQVFRRPVFGFKGSFIVASVKAEMDVGFDFGPKESIAEDLRFALTAWDKSYTFGFVHGTMVEKSTFTFLDFIKQRKRWFTGHFHVLWGHSVPLYCKVILLPLNIVNLFMWVQLMNTFFPPMKFLVPVPVYVLVLSFMIPSVLFSYVLGNYMSFRRRRFRMYRVLFLVLCSQLLMPLTGVLEATATLWGFFTRNNITFHIVEKQRLPSKRLRSTEIV